MSKKEGFRTTVLKIEECGQVEYDCPDGDDPCAGCRTDNILKAHNAVIREIRDEVNTITCLDNYKDMSEAVTKLVFSLKQKYGGE